MKAAELRQTYQRGGFYSLSDEQLKRFAAIEPNKFEEVAAEYVRRKAEQRTEHKRIHSSKDANDYLQPLYYGLTEERFIVMMLNRRGEVLGYRVVGVGGG